MSSNDSHVVLSWPRLSVEHSRSNLSLFQQISLQHPCLVVCARLARFAMKIPQKQLRAPSMLQEEQVVAIFSAKFGAQPRDGTSAWLAKTFNTTTKVVRDIWNVRTWTSATRPYWTAKDKEVYIKTRTQFAKGNGEKANDIVRACENIVALARETRIRNTRPSAPGNCCDDMIVLRVVPALRDNTLAPRHPTPHHMPLTASALAHAAGAVA